MVKMRLNADKSLSQQQLAIKLRVEVPENSGWLNLERRRLLTHAAKTALAASLSWWIAMRFGLRDGYWGAISSIIVLQSNFGATVSASRDRIIGTLIGAALGFSCTLFGVLPWNFILAVLAAIIVCGLLGLRSSSRLAGVTISIVMEFLWRWPSPPWSFPIARGCVCATAWPRNSCCWAHSSRAFSKAFAAHPRRIFPRCAKMC
jgi:uncharacterized membrane protein YccC